MQKEKKHICIYELTSRCTRRRIPVVSLQSSAILVVISRLSTSFPGATRILRGPRELACVPHRDRERETKEERETKRKRKERKRERERTARRTLRRLFSNYSAKSVADRGTFPRGSKSWGRGWLLLIKTWPRLGSPIGLPVCVERTYVRVCTREGIVAACRCGRGHKPCPDRYTRSMLHITPARYRPGIRTSTTGEFRRHSEFSADSRLCLPFSHLARASNRNRRICWKNIYISFRILQRRGRNACLDLRRSALLREARRHLEWNVLKFSRIYPIASPPLIFSCDHDDTCFARLFHRDMYSGLNTVQMAAHQAVKIVRVIARWIYAIIIQLII